RRDARGVVATLTHDALGRLVQVSYPDPSENVAHAYDQGTNGIGRLTGRIDQGGEYAFAYNERGLLRRESRTVLGNTYVTKYRYNKDDDLRRVIYPSGRYVTYGRDAAGRVRRVVSLENDVETVLARKIAYLPFGPMTGLTYGNGVSATLAYDGRYHMTSRSFQGSGALEAVLSASLPRTYQYDAMDRLIGAQGVFGDLVYEYDPVGNRLSETRNGQTSLYQYDAAGRLTSVDGPVPRTFSYDVAGNVVGLDNLTLTYNQAGRLASVAGPEGAVAEYTYNALEQRVVKKTGGRRIFHYDMQGNLIAENPRRQGIRKEYVWLNGELLAMIRSLPEPKTDKIFYYANDHLGTPQAMTNDKKHVVWQARYDPFGAAALGRANTRTSNLRLPGQYYDDEIGLHYNWHRYYDPGVGRYLRVDPLFQNQPLGNGTPHVMQFRQQDPLDLSPYIYGKTIPSFGLTE
ncbi:MAG: RHS domain-containing protein, partial [Proteobacteria bacterium]|nr:RHS domain-containing protein [Pseudomonadota bacterium]